MRWWSQLSPGARRVVGMVVAAALLHACFGLAMALSGCSRPPTNDCHGAAVEQACGEWARLVDGRRQKRLALCGKQDTDGHWLASPEQCNRSIDVIEDELEDIKASCLDAASKERRDVEMTLTESLLLYNYIEDFAAAWKRVTACYGHGVRIRRKDGRWQVVVTNVVPDASGWFCPLTTVVEERDELVDLARLRLPTTTEEEAPCTAQG